MLARTTLLAHHGGAMLPAHRIPPEVTSACRRLQEAGYAAYVVGGAVRDLLRCPDDDTAKDFDLTTSATPDQVIAIFGHRKVIPTGIAHGTVTVLCCLLYTSHQGPSRCGFRSHSQSQPTHRPNSVGCG